MIATNFNSIGIIVIATICFLSLILNLILAILYLQRKKLFHHNFEEINLQLKNEKDRRQKIEEAWVQMKVKLEDEVDKRTTDLVDANEKLKKDILEHERLLVEKEKLEKWLENRTQELTITNQQLKNEIEVNTKMQAQLIQAAKLATLGELASSITHELNNPLAGILGFAQSISKNPGDLLKVREKSDKIIKTSLRMKNIVDHVRDFSRVSKKDDWKNISFDTPIKNSLMLLEEQLERRNISIKLELNGHEQIWGDANKLESIFQNLITNSRDAFENIGDKREKLITIRSEVLDNQLKITYTDNASGMSPEIVSKMFEPFFTTKEPGKGTGLGMSVTHSILEEHKATIKVTTKINEGTTFEMWFPVNSNGSADAVTPGVSNDSQYSVEVEKSLAETLDIKTALATSNNRKYSLLVIDDEEIICEVITDLLQEYFEIKSISNANMAVEEIKKCKNQEYHLVITDISMPGVDGLEIIRLCKQHLPSVPVMVMSGHSPTEKEVQDALSAGAKGFISKPFPDLTELVSNLYSCIGHLSN